MSSMYFVLVSDDAEKRLQAIAAELGRDVDDLIATAAEEAALNHFRHRNDDPARKDSE